MAKHVIQQQALIITKQPFLSSHSSHSIAILACCLHIVEKLELILHWLMAKLLIIQLLSYQACMLCGIIMSTPFQMGA